MADMRLVILGAGGRMGRTLVKAIADAKGATLVGAVDAPGSAVIGRDAGELAGLGPNGIKVGTGPAPRCGRAPCPPAPRGCRRAPGSARRIC